MAKTCGVEKVGLAFRLRVSNGAKAANAKSLAPRRATFIILPPESNVRDLVGARTQAILALTVGSTPGAAGKRQFNFLIISSWRTQFSVLSRPGVATPPSFRGSLPLSPSVGWLISCRWR